MTIAEQLPGIAERIAWPRHCDEVGASAVFSDCRLYRYALFRVWNPDRPLVMFVGLNPSTADERANDPTVRRCIGFARSWGYGGLIMANLYAFRATRPADLHAAAAPLGAQTDAWLVRLRARSGLVVAAWGADPGPRLHRPADVMDLLGGLHVLGLTKYQAPRHPLYMPAVTRPQRWTFA